MAELVGNVLVGQSGGPTAVINASVAGIVAEALNHECIEEIYGALNGVLGILQEDLIDLAAESQQQIRALRHTPGAALGTCRYKLKKQSDYERVLEVFKAHNIRYFFYIGGNDSQDTADKISKLAQQQGYELRVIGVPKTIDNDLPITDHTPGYGSVVKYTATTIRELACDHEAMGQGDLVSIVEVMGRSAGWIAAGAALAKRRDHPHDPPHLIYLPEIPFDQAKCLEDVRRVLKREKFCMVVVGEGLIDADGNYVAADAATDSFGHAQLGGAGDFLKELVETNIPGVKARLAKPGIIQRAAAHAGSKTDADEAFLAGQAAVQAAIKGETDKMVTLVRGDTDHYTCETGLAPLAEIANGVKKLPREWINEDGTSMNFQFLRYAQPLIQGEVAVPFESGVPVFARLDKVRVDKTLPAFVA
ncbi:6-phosphofructokinase [Opitutus terrae]|uniref:Pyrophosphate--fructose 6-phosphate 1-phosphotransferase n=1 Tax=Opitutus terrae (strain DSM 11246 / JCM 15787 / PB90-1) TaxID=452637 RepID=B1ZS10_OPITP|nr:6-phosphofructokinase [Opitutus terrae]ACB74686.1 phosphofructokinase [Opitutus terrae PB90-1]